MRHTDDNSRLVLFIALGTLVHLPLFFWQGRPIVVESPPAIAVKLLPPQDAVETAVEPDPPPQRVEPAPEPPPPVEPPPVEPSPSEPLTAPAPEPAAETVTAPQLSPQQVREQIRVLALEPADEDGDKDVIERTYTAFVPNGLPALPSDPGDGELGGYMMLDKEIVTHFKDVNGWDRAEVTLRDGTIMCGERSRNQFMPDSILDSTNIFTWKVCRKGFTGGR